LTQAFAVEHRLSCGPAFLDVDVRRNRAKRRRLRAEGRVSARNWLTIFILDGLLHLRCHADGFIEPGCNLALAASMYFFFSFIVRHRYSRSHIDPFHGFCAGFQNLRGWGNYTFCWPVTGNGWTVFVYAPKYGWQEGGGSFSSFPWSLDEVHGEARRSRSAGGGVMMECRTCSV